MFVLYNKCLLACLLFEKKKADRREFASHLFRIASLQKKKKKFPRNVGSQLFLLLFFFLSPAKSLPLFYQREIKHVVINRTFPNSTEQLERKLSLKQFNDMPTDENALKE